jgi:tetratricopeptide (TPR) repeat protein
MAITLRAIGDGLVDLGRIDEAVPVLERSIALREEIVAADPANVRALRDLGVGHSALGYAYDLAGRPGDALPEYRQWLKIADDGARRDPGLVNVNDRETARWSIAEMALRLHRPAEALAEARTVERNLVPKDSEPADDKSLEALGNARLIAGRSLAAMGSATAGYATATRGAADLATIAVRAPEDAILGRDAARARIQAGFVGLAAGTAFRAEACRAIVAGRDALAALDAAGKLNPAYRIHLDHARAVGPRCDPPATASRTASR